jgi:P2-related tail formation protein
MRRAIALKDWLAERQQQDRWQDEDRREQRRAQIAQRRHSVAVSVS